jgi:alpha-L-fucosidase
MSDRPVPTWFDDAKFGIFVHWTAAAVPAFAPVTDSPFDFAGTSGWEEALRNMPYVEWYQNSLSIPGSPVAEHHAATYGDAPYDDFVREFCAGHAGWRPDLWADLFHAAGAQYVVFVTKHHDGALLWPSATPNPFKAGWGSERDLVGELADAVRDRGMRFGIYYSGGLDWTFGGLPMTDLPSVLRAIPQTEEYLAYANGHWRELIERYEPCSMWNDIGYPAAADLDELFGFFYDRVPDGVINNRFDMLRQTSGQVHCDFITPEYSTTGDARKKFEVCRGLGSSFGFNRWEDDSTYLTSSALVETLVDIVARGGNFLLNVGPTGIGRVPWAQAERLRAMGEWLAVNGEAIFGTRPWGPTAAETTDGLRVRFTAKGDAVYAILLDQPTVRDVVIPAVGDATRVQQLGHDADLITRPAEDGGVHVTLPEVPDAQQPALTLVFHQPA